MQTKNLSRNNKALIDNSDITMTHNFLKEDSDFASSISHPKNYQNITPQYEFNNSPRFSEEGKTVITKFVFLNKPVTIIDVFPFAVVFFIYGLIIQTILSIWKKFHSKSHDLFLLFLVVVMPPILQLCFKDSIFCILWMVFISFMCSYLKKALANPIHKETPKNLYRAFKLIFLYSYAAISIGQFATIFSFLFFINYLVLSLRILFYSLYFAVLSREVILNLSHLMASKTGFFSKEGIPGLADSTNVCMICTDNLNKEGKILTLSCGHNYHEECVKGWFMIGQNQFCPYCKKGIDTDIFNCNFFDKTMLTFKPIMNFIRSFISFFIITFFYLMIKTRNRI